LAPKNIFRRYKAPLDTKCCHFKALLKKVGKIDYIAGECRIMCCNTSATIALLSSVTKFTPCTIIYTINTTTKPITCDHYSIKIHGDIKLTYISQ
jgi:hypothetical protein